MSKAFRAAVFFILSTSHMAQAQYTGNPQLNACGVSYRSDSYGRGLEAGFRGTNTRPRFVDSLCYQLGVKRGQELQRLDCARGFERGYEQGSLVSSLVTGSTCFEAGYAAAKATILVGARESNVILTTPACIAQYERAYRAGLNHNGTAVPLSPAVDRACYLAGYYDGEWFQIENLDI